MTRWLTLALSLVVIAIVLVDAFEAMLLPRRVSRNFRLARQFYRSTWRPWAAIGRRLGRGKRRGVRVNRAQGYLAVVVGGALE